MAPGAVADAVVVVAGEGPAGAAEQAVGFAAEALAVVGAAVAFGAAAAAACPLAVGLVAVADSALGIETVGAGSARTRLPGYQR